MALVRLGTGILLSVQLFLRAPEGWRPATRLMSQSLTATFQSKERLPFAIVLPRSSLGTAKYLLREREFLSSNARPLESVTVLARMKICLCFFLLNGWLRLKLGALLYCHIKFQDFYMCKPIRAVDLHAYALVVSAPSMKIGRSCWATVCT